MGSLLHADVLKLQEHTDILRRERNTVRLLVEQLRLARHYALPEDAWRYDRMIGKAGMLERYFEGMEEQVDNMGVELAKLSIEFNRMLADAGNMLKT